MKNGNGDPFVVSSSELSQVLQDWFERWGNERPYKHVPARGGDDFFAGSYKRSEHRFYGPFQYLHEQSGINTRTLHTILKCTSKWVTLENAEKLLMAIDREYMLASGEISVVPNPRWSQEHWQNYMAERGCV